jgi:hypothetical protein
MIDLIMTRLFEEAYYGMKTLWRCIMTDDRLNDDKKAFMKIWRLYKSDFMNYQLLADAKDKMKTLMQEDFMNHYQLYCISQRKRQTLLRRLRIIAALLYIYSWIFVKKMFSFIIFHIYCPFRFKIHVNLLL